MMMHKQENYQFLPAKAVIAVPSLSNYSKVLGTMQNTFQVFSFN